MSAYCIIKVRLLVWRIVLRWGATRAPGEVSWGSDAFGRRSFFIGRPNNHSSRETKAKTLREALVLQFSLTINP